MKSHSKTVKASEFLIETSILQFLNMVPGCFAFKVETRGYYNPKKGIYQKNKSKFVIPGTSDIIGIYKGRFFALEVKSATGTASDDQRIFIASIKGCGGIAGIVRGIPDACELLDIPFNTSVTSRTLTQTT
jgi:hypothetical protein